MYHRQVPNLCSLTKEKQQTDTKDMNPNKNLSWSSIKSNCQEQISPLNYKLSNPSSSLIISSLSHIQQDDVETTGSTTMCQNSKQELNKKIIKIKEQKNTAHQDFYQYLMDENESHKSVQMNIEHIKKSKPAHNNLTNKYMQQDPDISQNNNPDKNHQPICNNKNFTLMDYHSGYSAQQSLIHLEQSQQQLSFLKFKLQQAYEKLEKEIMNSYLLEQKIECLKAQIQGREELIELEKNQNQKLKFTLKAIMKNKSFLEQEMQKGETKKNTPNQTDRQNELKYNLKLKLELKELTNKIKSYQDSLKSYQEKNQSLESQNSTLTNQLTQTKKQFTFLKQQIVKKDHYIQTLSQQLLQIDSIKAQNKKFLVKQAQYLNQINVIELELRKVTDQKVTSIARIKHELAIEQKQNEELLEQNEALNRGQRHNVTESQIISYSPVGLPPTQFVAYSPSPVSKKYIAKSVNKYSNHNIQQMNHSSLQPTIFDLEEQTQKSSQLSDRFNNYKQNTSIQTYNQNESLNFCNPLNSNQRRSVIFDENKENMQSENIQQSFAKRLKEETLKTDTTVGKWKKIRSQSNNSSLHIQAPPKQHNHHHIRYPDQLSIHAIKVPSDPNYNIINQNLSPTLPTETEDQKLSKYQQHRKKIESQLSNLEKLKRPSLQERQKMQKLQKQLYYIDSDIAGLKRKIRRKY